MLVMQRDTSLSKQAQKVLNALIACGPGWHSRAAIARVMHKVRLNPSEVTLLNWLVESGRVEAERHLIDGPMPLQWEYRLKGGEPIEK